MSAWVGQRGRNRYRITITIFTVLPKSSKMRVRKVVPEWPIQALCDQRGGSGFLAYRNKSSKKNTFSQIIVYIFWKLFSRFSKYILEFGKKCFLRICSEIRSHLADHRELLKKKLSSHLESIFFSKKKFDILFWSGNNEKNGNLFSSNICEISFFHPQNLQRGDPLGFWS